MSRRRSRSRGRLKPINPWDMNRLRELRERGYRLEVIRDKSTLFHHREIIYEWGYRGYGHRPSPTEIEAAIANFNRMNRLRELREGGYRLEVIRDKSTLSHHTEIIYEWGYRHRPSPTEIEAAIANFDQRRQALEADLNIIKKRTMRGSNSKQAAKEYREVGDVKDIVQYNHDLTIIMKSLLLYHDVRVINGKRNDVYFLREDGNQVLWWSGRPWFSEKKALPSYHNLFGYGRRGDSDPLVTEAEFNIPLDKPRKNLEGAFVRDLKTGSILLAHRGQATYGTKIPRDQFLAAWEEIKAPVIRTCDNPKPFALIGDIASPRLDEELTEFVKNFCEAKRAWRVIFQKASTASFQGMDPAREQAGGSGI